MREPRPDWSPLGVNFKILDEHSHLLFIFESNHPPTPPPLPGQWCDFFWRPEALHKWNFAVTSRTWSAAHASRRSFLWGSKTGLEKTAEIERKTLCEDANVNKRKESALKSKTPDEIAAKKVTGSPARDRFSLAYEALWHSGG